MVTSKLSFWEAFDSRDDLKQFGVDALLLFALELTFGIEDIELIATTSLTEGSGDKKADLVYIDSEAHRAVIAQTYIASQTTGRSGRPKEAPANKASDLNTAVGWLLTRPMEELPTNLRPHAEELRQALQDKTINLLQFWYVHNLRESYNVHEELTTVTHTAKTAINSSYPDCTDIEIQALEIGVHTLEEWYESMSTPILVADEYTVPVTGGFKITSGDWNAYVTSIPAKWLYEQYKKHGTKLFSANVRDYLGSRQTDQNINNGIKKTAFSDPCHFWVYNNGITVLVHKFEEKVDDSGKKIYFKGISIVNGAQTAGAIGSLSTAPEEKAKVQVRFITCTNPETVYNIVRYNNNQNKITAPDFRSNDIIQRRLASEFQNIPAVEYQPRRGGHEDRITRRPNVLPSIIAGQALAAFHNDPHIAYHKRTHMWEDDGLYNKYFNTLTTAKHIIFAYSLLKAVEKKKWSLLDKSRNNNLTQVEQDQLTFFRKRGSIFLMVAAIAKCLETIINKQIPNLFSLTFKHNLSPELAAEKWDPIVETVSPFTAPLAKGLADGFRNREAVENAVTEFRSYVAAMGLANRSIFAAFTKEVT